MANRAIRLGLGFGLLLCSLVATSAPSEAALVLRVSDGSTTFTIADGDVNDAVADDGAVGFIGSVGDFFLNVIAGISKPQLGPAVLDLASVNLFNAAGGGTLTMELTDTDFDFGLGQPGFLEWAWGGTINGGSIVGQAWKDPSNAEFGHGSITSGELGPFTGPAFSTSGSVGHGILTDVYSMSIRLIYTTTGGSQFVSGNFTVQNVPEPAELLLFGLGLSAVGLAARRRRRSQ